MPDLSVVYSCEELAALAAQEQKVFDELSAACDEAIKECEEAATNYKQAKKALDGAAAADEAAVREAKAARESAGDSHIRQNGQWVKNPAWWKADAAVGAAQAKAAKDAKPLGEVVDDTKTLWDDALARMNQLVQDMHDSKARLDRINDALTRCKPKVKRVAAGAAGLLLGTGLVAVAVGILVHDSDPVVVEPQEIVRPADSVQPSESLDQSMSPGPSAEQVTPPTEAAISVDPAPSQRADHPADAMQPRGSAARPDAPAGRPDERRPTGSSSGSDARRPATGPAGPPSEQPRPASGEQARDDTGTHHDERTERSDRTASDGSSSSSSTSSSSSSTSSSSSSSSRGESYTNTGGRSEGTGSTEHDDRGHEDRERRNHHDRESRERDHQPEG